MLAELLVGGALAGDALYAAVEAGDLAAVEAALAAGESPADPHATTTVSRTLVIFSKRTTTYDTALHVAVERALAGKARADKVLDRLIAASRGVDATTDDVGTPLSLAVNGAAVSTRADGVVTKLLAAGASAERAAPALAVRWRAKGALSSSERAVLDRLVAHGARTGTVLCGAAAEGDLVLARHLLDGGADPNATCARGSPLREAALGDHAAVAQLLARSGADRSVVTDDGGTVFDGALAVADVLALGPVDARTEAALIVAWSGGHASDEDVAALPFSAVGHDLATLAVARAGALSFVDAYGALGGEAFAAQLTGPLRAALAGEPWTLGCPLARGATPPAVSAAIEAELARDWRRAGVSEWAWDGGRAGFVRYGTFRAPALEWVDLPPACDPFGGALVGSPRAVVRVALGRPEAANVGRDVYPAPGATRVGDRLAWYVVEYVEDRATTVRIDWRRW